MVVEAGTPLILESIVDLDGRQIPTKDVLVEYYKADGTPVYNGALGCLDAGDYKVVVSYNALRARTR